MYTPNTIAQVNNLRFDRLQSSDGLSSNNVRCITQDHRGFLWIGTQNGLNRYDGKNFKKFYNTVGDSTTISANWINTIYEDSDNNLWIGTRSGGLNLYVRETGKFINLQNDPDNPNSISGNNVWSIYEDSNNNLWVGTKGSGLNLFDRKEGTFKRWINDLDNKNSISNNSVSAITEDRYGRLWIGTDGSGISIFDYSNNTFRTWDEITLNKCKYQFDYISSITRDSKGNILIGAESVLTKYTPSDGSVKQWHTAAKLNEQSSGFIVEIIEDDIGNFWIATRDAGLGYFDINKEEFSYSQTSSSNYSLSNNEVLAIFVDKTNVLWIGSHGGGINKFNIKNLAFKYWTHDPNSKIGLPHKEVRKLLLEKDGILWIGTNNGLSKFDRRKNVFKNYEIIPKNSSGSKINRIRSIYRSKKGVLYVSLDRWGLNEYNETRDRFISYLPESQRDGGRSSRNTRTICEDSHGILWLGTYNGGLHRFDPETKTLSWIPIKFKNSEAFENEHIEIILKHNKDQIWIGSDNGLILFNTITYQAQKWEVEEGNSNSLVQNSIRSLYEDENGILWIGTRGGLSRFDYKNDQFTNFTIINGLPSNLIYGIIRSSIYDMWLVTMNGLSKFSDGEFLFKNHLVPFNNRFDVGINSVSNPSEIILGGKNGLTIFNSDLIKKNKNIPEVVFTEFRKYNVPIKMEKDYSEVSLLNFDYSENMFSISFASLDFSDPSSNLYSYKLEGFNETWIDLNNKSSVTFTNLDPGKYKLLVKASNSDGVWNENPSVLEINIIPPLWKRTYFQISLLILMILFVGIGIKIKFRNIEKQNKKLDELIKLRTNELESEIDEREKIGARLQELNANKDKFFSIISHDLRSPFTAITGLSEYILSDFNSFSGAEMKEAFSTIDKSSKRVYNLLENLLDWSRIQTGRMVFKPEVFLIDSIIDEVISLYEGNYKKKRIKMVFEHLKKTEVFGDYEMVYTILRNLVSNAIKFTNEDGRIQISLKTKDDNVIVSVADKGAGMDKDTCDKLFRIDVEHSTPGTDQEKGTGLGLILCKELVENNNGKIWVESEGGVGTSFYFTLPLPN